MQQHARVLRRAGLSTELIGDSMMRTLFPPRPEHTIGPFGTIGPFSISGQIRSDHAPDVGMTTESITEAVIRTGAIAVDDPSLILNNLLRGAGMTPATMIEGFRRGPAASTITCTLRFYGGNIHFYDEAGDLILAGPCNPICVDAITPGNNFTYTVQRPMPDGNTRGGHFSTNCLHVRAPNVFAVEAVDISPLLGVVTLAVIAQPIPPPPFPPQLD